MYLQYLSIHHFARLGYPFTDRLLSCHQLNKALELETLATVLNYGDSITHVLFYE
jgi:hypothetical protein